MNVALKLCRLLSLVLLSVLGTSALMYTAPGYFAESREMDAAYAAGARSALNRMQIEQHSLPALLRLEVSGWLHGDWGQSRQFGVPVAGLICERAAHSAVLLSEGVLLGWSAALMVALPFSLMRNAAANMLVSLLTALLLAIPVGVLATVCLLAGHGGPVIVLAVVVAARDCKLLYRIFRDAWSAPFVAHAHSQGLSTLQIGTVHLVSVLRRELLSVGLISFTLALSALVPVEMIFDGAGLGQLAWTAAMNRDLPVLVAVTALMSVCVGAAGALLTSPRAKATACV